MDEIINNIYAGTLAVANAVNEKCLAMDGRNVYHFVVLEESEKRGIVIDQQWFLDINSLEFYPFLQYYNSCALQEVVLNTPYILKYHKLILTDMELEENLDKAKEAYRYYLLMQSLEEKGIIPFYKRSFETLQHLAEEGKNFQTINSKPAKILQFSRFQKRIIEHASRD